MIERVWRAGGTFQEWSERFQLDRWLDAMAAEGLDPDWYVTRHRTDDEILPWDHIAAGLHRDFLWDDWQEALRRTASPIAGGLPATTVGCAPTTPSSTSWRRRCRRPAAARAPDRVSASAARPRRARSPVPVRAGCPSEGRFGLPGAHPVRQAGQGAVHLGPRRRPRAASGPSASSSCRSPSPRGSRPDPR